MNQSATFDALSMEHQGELLATLVNRSPDLVAAFQLPELQAVFLNSAGRYHLDPGGKTALEDFPLPEIIGVECLDRFKREVLPQIQVYGHWTGALKIRDAWGSETKSNVTLVKLPPAADGKLALIGMFASLPDTTSAADSTSVTDQEMLHALLESVPERIYFKDAKSRFLRISRSKAVKHKLADARDIIGKTDFDFYSVEHAANAFTVEQEILRSGKGVIDREECETYPDGTVSWSSTTKLPFYDRAGKLIGTFGISHNITERKRAVEDLRRLSQVVEQAPVSIVITDTAGRIEFVNPWFEQITGYASSEVLGKSPAILNSGSQPPEFYRNLWETISAGKEWNGVFANRRKSGEIFHEKASIYPLHSPTGKITHYVSVKEDISEQRRVEAENAEMESRLHLSQKLESVGQLAAGVAHEINTPTQFIADNLRFLRESFDSLRPLLARYQSLADMAAGHPALSQLAREIAELAAEREQDYLLAEVPRSIAQTQEGVQRIAKIVGSLKEFSHPSATEKSLADLNRAIETAITVSRHEWKYVAEVVTELDPALPGVHCVLDEINQVLLNLIVNAAHAIGDANPQRLRERGRITIRTRPDGTCVVIEIEDDGTGMSAEVQRRLFEPFFTTKGIGKGTGQGLGIVRNVVVKRHAGKIDVISQPDVGTKFRLLLPIHPLPIVETPAASP